jgi:hypothetical protein
MGLYWMPCGKALPENAPVCLPCDRPFQATEASHRPLPDNLRESICPFSRGEIDERIEIS